MPKMRYAVRSAVTGLAAWLLAHAAFAQVTLMHVHGLAYGPDGKRLFIPSHTGLAVYEGGRWTKAPGPEHDYMGFSIAREAMYSSGHPAPGSSLKNPFGLLKSTDGGKSWQNLGLGGEADFHVMAASYEARAVYVLSAARNSRMREPGIYASVDDGKSWKRAPASGLSGRVLTIGVHPSQAGTVAVGSDAGGFLSQDFGASFARIATGQVTSVLFDLDGSHVWIGGYENGAKLDRMNLKDMKPTSVVLPPMTKDAVSFIAQNPVRRSELAIATFNRNVYHSSDAGRRWKQIAAEGATRDDR